MSKLQYILLPLYRYMYECLITQFTRRPQPRVSSQRKTTVQSIHDIMVQSFGSERVKRNQIKVHVLVFVDSFVFIHFENESISICD